MAKKRKEDDKKDDMSDGSIAVNDAWTGMLAISLIALVVACAFLGYDYFVVMAATEPSAKNVSKPGPAPKIVVPKAEEPKEKDKDKEPEKDKGKEPEKEKEKDKAFQPMDAPEFAPSSPGISAAFPGGRAPLYSIDRRTTSANRRALRGA